MPKANGHYQSFSSPDSSVVPPGRKPRLQPYRRAVPSSWRRIVEVTDSVCLPDGRILDLVTTPGPRTELTLVAWRGGEFTHARQLESGGVVYVPPELPKGLKRAVQLPAGIGPLLTARELLGEIQDLIETYLDVSDDDAFRISVFVLSTFFCDRLSFAPYLVICGPPGSGKTRLERLLWCVTRRAVHVGGMTPASLYRLTDLLCPTVLIDEADFIGDKPNRDLLRILRNGNSPGADFHIAGNLYRTFGPKVICSRQPLEDAALSSRAIHITMMPSRNDYPPLDQHAQARIARELQPKLERFRLEHYGDVSIPENLKLSRTTPRGRELARSLAAPISSDPELVERLETLMRIEDEHARVDHYRQPEWAVMSALLECSHGPSTREFIGNLAARVTEVLAHMGEAPLAPRRVGQIVRTSLGLETKKVGRGYYVSLPPSRKRDIHLKARRMGICKADILDSMAVEDGYGGRPCELCSEFGLNTRPDGSELRCVAPLPIPHKGKGLFEK